MTGGIHARPIKASGGDGEVRSHTLTAVSGTGPILVSVDHSQSAPVNEIDDTIQWNPVIQSFGYEEEAGPLHVSTDIGVLSDDLAGDEDSMYNVEIDSTRMVAREEAEVTITTRFHTTDPSVKGVYSPMIEIPIAGFTFDNLSQITENGTRCAYEVVNGTTGNEHKSLFIESRAWEKDMEMTYKFNITPEDHGALDLDLRIRPLYNDTNVYLTNKTFTVMGRGNVSVNVVDEDGVSVKAESITLGANAVQNQSSYDFTGILNGTYTLVVNGTGGYPSIRTAARVTPGATALCNVTLPSSLLSPTLVYSEGGAGSIAGVAQVPAGRLSAAYAENTTYTVTVLGDGGEIGIALEFPMRYLVNGPPKVKVNDAPAEYELINGTFEYLSNKTYLTTNAALIVYNTIVGSNTIEIEFKGGLLGDATSNNIVNIYDVVDILNFIVGNIGDDKFKKAYDYSDATKNGITNIYDAVAILNYLVGNTDQYYDPIL